MAEPRRFTDDDKARIVSEAMMPGANVGDVSRRYRVCKSLIYRWRRMLLRDGVAVRTAQLPAPTFVPVEVAIMPVASQPEPLGPGVVEVLGSGGQRVRLAPPIDARVLKAVLAGFG
ncbi:IS66-like element accessory protein TnpA [Sphingomonas sp.]|uniref:IS66-like element accessory protein TnpA n=1 Tax=Sphingomonas sp. TaxID=28214 RepID=UPI002ED9B139